MSTTVKRKWSEQQKLQIIQEAQQNRVTETMRKYNDELGSLINLLK